jgi:signal transduction histidine kinase
VAQALYSINLFTDATLMAWETNKPEVVEANLGELADLSRQAMADMRLLIFELRPPALEEVGLVAALQSRLNAVETRTGMQAVIDFEGTFHLSAEEEDQLYRITQEALNNVIKHAHANQVKVQLTGEAGCVRLTIEDDGIGFDAVVGGQAGGHGIRNIHERAEKIGARCWIDSAPGQGTKVTIEVNK